MKKIVALVLALALVLSLCTVAMAATKVKVGELYAYNDEEVLEGVVASGSDVVFNKAKAVKLTSNGKAVDTMGNVAFYAYDGDEYVACKADDDDACYALYTKSGWVYLKEAEEVQYAVKATKLVKDECVNDNHQLYSYVNYADGKTYYAEKVAGGEVWALVDGEVLFLEVDSKDLVATHTWEVATYEEDGITAATLKCEDCKVTAKIITYAESLTADKTLVVDDVTYGYLLMSAAPAVAGTATTTTTVDSSKTFDAGVAMYVGLSLMSVAGSAVVIGKKKEF